MRSRRRDAYHSRSLLVLMLRPDTRGKITEDASRQVRCRGARAPGSVVALSDPRQQLIARRNTAFHRGRAGDDDEGRRASRRSAIPRAAEMAGATPFALPRRSAGTQPRDFLAVSQAFGKEIRRMTCGKQSALKMRVKRAEFLRVPAARLERARDAEHVLSCVAIDEL